MCGCGKIKQSNVDCDEGRKLGCNTFCCRLLVRLDPEEREPSTNDLPAKGYVDKDEDGNCIHLDLDKGWCRIWDRRPRVCREYECNSDFFLQVALKHGFKSIGTLAKDSLKTYIPKEFYRKVPLTRCPDCDE